MDFRKDATSSGEPIIINRADLPEFPKCLENVLRVEQDEDGTYIIGDYRTVVYGDGDTFWEALCDYIVSLIEYTELLVYDNIREKKEKE